MERAVLGGREEAAALLVQAGAEVGLVESMLLGEGDAALSRLENGAAEVNSVTQSGLTALMAATAKSLSSAMQTLLERGADPNRLDTLGRTALTWAITQKRADLAELLIAHGADVNHRSEEGRFALTTAVQIHSPEMVRLLAAHGADVNGRDKRGWTALHHAALAAHRGNTAVIPVLLELGADINAPDLRGQTPLMAAASFESLEAVRVLLTHGADTSHQDEIGRTALMEAYRHPEVLGLLKEADPQAFGLLEAASHGDVAQVETLLASGASLHAKDEQGRTALGLAALNQHFELVRWLLDHGTQTDAKERLLVSLLARAAGQNDIAERL